DEAFRTRSLVLQPGAQGQSLLLLPARERLPTLFALSGLVLILSCLNIAGLMLVRGSARKGELAVRVSMGATRGRLATLMLAESVLLALPAALLSLPVALLTLSVIASTFPAIQASPFSTFEASAAFDVSVDFAAMLVAISGAMLSALAFTLLPVTD